MVVSRSTNNGQGWRRPKRIASDNTNVGILLDVGSDGTVYAVWSSASATDLNLSIHFAKSTNGGKKFSRPTKIADLLALGVPGYRTGAILPSLAIAPTTDDLYVAWADARFTGVDQAALIVSRDGGETWSAPSRASDGPPESPAMTVSVATNAVGEVLVGYYTLRNDPTRTTTVDYYVNRSTDGALSFEPGVRVTRRSFDASQAARADGASSSIFLGDYVGLAGAGDRFLAVFTSTEKRSALGPGRQPDIFAAISR
jgi:hypothetical protein